MPSYCLRWVSGLVLARGHRLNLVQWILLYNIAHNRISTVSQVSQRSEKSLHSRGEVRYSRDKRLLIVETHVASPIALSILL